MDAVSGAWAQDSSCAVDVFVGEQIGLGAGKAFRGMGLRFIHRSLRHCNFVGRGRIDVLAPELGKESFGLHNFPFSTWGRAFGLILSTSNRIGPTTRAALRIGFMSAARGAAYATRRSIRAEQIRAGNWVQGIDSD